ncbi:O-antigen ligase family protein [Glaesserella sp.]|uniref:O-antigen ligase family protein n=1 Tax=Glaesserella sp. TaxID=2094731 RepID=UPI00359F2D3D
MPAIFEKINRNHTTLAVNILVALFFVTVLTFNKGYSYAPMMLGISAMIYLFIYLFGFKKKLSPSQHDKQLIFAFITYFATFVVSTVVHSDGFRVIDNPSRVLLFLPLILLFTHFPLRLNMILHAIPVGAATVGLLAIYQKFYLGLAKPFPDTMHIQAGNISIALAAFSLVIALYWGIKKEFKFTLLCLLGALFGVLASALSGARGGWIGLPFVVATILFFYRQNLSKRFILLVVGIFTTFITLLVINPNTEVIQRYHVAKSDLTLYFEKGHKNTSLGARFDMWENAILGIQEKPILGWGSEGYQELKHSQVQNKTMAQSTLSFNDTHNQYLESWVKRGIVGLIGLLLILFVPLRYFFKRVNSDNLELKCIAVLGITHILSTMFYFLSQTFLAHNSGSIFYFFVLIVFYCLMKTQEKAISLKNS